MKRSPLSTFASRENLRPRISCWPDVCQGQGVSPAELNGLLGAGSVAVVDVGASRTYREAHIPGAYWVVRSRMALDLALLAPFKKLVLALRTSGWRIWRLSALGRKFGDVFYARRILNCVMVE